jgi:hypothetical protein
MSAKKSIGAFDEFRVGKFSIDQESLSLTFITQGRRKKKKEDLPKPVT